MSETNRASQLNIPDFKHQLKQELTANILPFWMEYSIDRTNGGFYGAVSNDLRINNDAPRSAVLCARILWTFSKAYNYFGDKAYLAIAHHAFDYLSNIFWDKKYGGVFFQVDSSGKPVNDRKYYYSQAFAIYGLSEYHRAVKTKESLEFAQQLFYLIEKNSFQPRYQGYADAHSRSYGRLFDPRWSRSEPRHTQSANTMLHILEAYTSLLRVWDDGELKAQHKKLLINFHKKIIDPQTNHFKLFFNDRWRFISNEVSYGHDVEGSWLLCQAAKLHQDADLLQLTREASIRIATAVYKQGFNADGYLSENKAIKNKAWWVQAEALIGFYNAYQLSDDIRFLSAVEQSWNFIQNHLIDRTHGDWFKYLNEDNTPDHSKPKIDAWNCPYHHSRACFELMERLDESNHA